MGKFKMEVTLEVFDTLEKKVRASGNGGAISCPKSWVGKRVKLCLMEQSDIKE
jgi:putative transposon-encoded protein